MEIDTGYWLLATGYRLSAAKAEYVFVRHTSSRDDCSERGLIASKDRSTLFAKSANPLLAIVGGGQVDNRLPL
jgi:hypothetical protein